MHSFTSHVYGIDPALSGFWKIGRRGANMYWILHVASQYFASGRISILIFDHFLVRWDERIEYALLGVWGNDWERPQRWYAWGRSSNPFFTERLWGVGKKSFLATIGPQFASLIEYFACTFYTEVNHLRHLRNTDVLIQTDQNRVYIQSHRSLIACNVRFLCRWSKFGGKENWSLIKMIDRIVHAHWTSHFEGLLLEFWMRFVYVATILLVYHTGNCLQRQ